VFFLFGDVISIADISLGAVFRNALLVGYNIDEARWPCFKEYLMRLMVLEQFKVLNLFEETCMKTRIKDQRDVLKNIGAPITLNSRYGTLERPKQGYMSKKIS